MFSSNLTTFKTKFSIDNHPILLQTSLPSSCPASVNDITNLPDTQSRNSIPSFLLHSKFRVHSPNRFPTSTLFPLFIHHRGAERIVIYKYIHPFIWQIFADAYYVPSTIPGMTFWAEETNWEKFEHVILLLKTYLLSTASKIKCNSLAWCTKPLKI